MIFIEVGVARRPEDDYVALLELKDLPGQQLVQSLALTAADARAVGGSLLSAAAEIEARS